MKKFWFTFGFGQRYENCYTVIEAEDKMAALDEMNRRWGKEWSMQYDSAEGAGVKLFNLKEIK